MSHCSYDMNPTYNDFFIRNGGKVLYAVNFVINYARDQEQDSELAKDYQLARLPTHVLDGDYDYLRSKLFPIGFIAGGFPDPESDYSCDDEW